MILIGLGANLESKFGQPESTISHVMDVFPEYGISVLSKSSIWKTAPMPMSDQPWYKNAVCSVHTEYNPHELLKAINQIEKDFGRVRSIQDAPRVIDLDILCYNDLHIVEGNLEIPHPRMCERAFVLYPLIEIQPNWKHPITNLPIDFLIENLSDEQKIELA